MRTALIVLGLAAAAGAALALTPTFEQPDVQALARPAGRAAATAASPMSAATAADPQIARVKFAAGAAAPEPDAATPGTTAPAVPAGPTLVGLVLGGARPAAYVMIGPRAWRASVGEPVGPWRLAAIGRHEVTLRRGGQSLTLRLFTARAALSPQMPVSPFAPGSLASAAPPAAAAAPPPASPAAVPAAVQTHTAAPPAIHAPPPANAPKYWVGPPGSAPPGYTPMPAGDLPPPPVGRRR